MSEKENNLKICQAFHTLMDAFLFSVKDRDEMAEQRGKVLMAYGLLLETMKVKHSEVLSSPMADYRDKVRIDQFDEDIVFVEPLSADVSCSNCGKVVVAAKLHTCPGEESEDDESEDEKE